MCTEVFSMTRHLVEKSWSSRNLNLERGDVLLLLDTPNKPFVTARTRHGRNIRVPLSILGQEIVPFNCQLCEISPFPCYSTYTAHQIEAHFSNELVGGLDRTGLTPTCPFPACSNTVWPGIDSLLMHYASHHHVLEKLMMYEGEREAVKLRKVIAAQDIKLEELRERVRTLQGALATHSEAAEIGARQEAVVEREEEVNGKGEVSGKAEASSEARGKGEASSERDKMLFIRANALEEKPASIKDIIRKENEAATIIENQTLKTEFLQIKMEKEKIAKTLDNKNKELEKCRKEMEGMSKDTKSTVEMCKQWKALCIEGEEKLKREKERYQEKLTNLKRENEVFRKEIENLKSIIEIGKDTVENAKQVSCELAKDNKRRQAKEEEYEARIKKTENKLKTMQTDKDTMISSLRNHIRLMESQLQLNQKESNQVLENYKDFSSKYEAQKHVLRQHEQEVASLKQQLDQARYESDRKGRQEEERMSKDLEAASFTEARLRKELEAAGQLEARLRKDVEAAGDLEARLRMDLEAAGQLEARLRKDVEIAAHTEARQRKELEAGGQLEARLRKELEATEHKLSMKCEEASNLYNKMVKAINDLQSATSDNKRLKEQLEINIRQCSDLEKSARDSRKDLQSSKKHQDSLRKELKNEKYEWEKVRADLEKTVQFHKDQESVMVADIQQFKAEIAMRKDSESRLNIKVEDLETELKAKSASINNLVEEMKTIRNRGERSEEMLAKINLKNRVEDEYKKKCEQMAAQVKVQEWEIENYKTKLISCEMLMAEMKYGEKCTPPPPPPSFHNNNNNNHHHHTTHLTDKVEQNKELEYHESSDYPETGSSACDDASIDVKIEIPEEPESVQSQSSDNNSSTSAREGCQQSSSGKRSAAETSCPESSSESKRVKSVHN